MQVKSMISGILYEFSYSFPKWDFLAGYPRITNPWESGTVHEWEAEKVQKILQLSRAHDLFLG